ncbi:hypothetical protein F2Q68_00008788 [Brassica cretica]|uniref:Uncharacterized protein n=1 Tax=Brassica cretica TaxID=69181 RepID=A0A8S9L3S2_BRACR|nr:hypothetical protein F2Q68_00008788 [Brassica cretica]
MRLSNWTNPFGVIISLIASSCFAPFPCLNLFRLSLHYGSGFLILEFSPLKRMLDIGGDSLALEFKHGGTARFLAGIRLLGCGDVGSTPLFGGCGNAVTSSEMAVGFGVWFSGSLRCRGDVLHISFKPGELRRLVVTEVFLFGCFTIDTNGLLNESRASDTLVLEVGKRRTDYVLVMTVSLLSYVSHPSTDDQTRFGDEGPGVQSGYQILG